MNKTPLLITVLLCLMAAAALSYISVSKELDLSSAELVNSYVAIGACLGAFVSATFVVFSYLQTNKAYIESQRPHLLIQIQNLVADKPDDSGNPIPMSRINYKNITNNRFSDLCIEIIVSAQNREIYLDNLFRKNMAMIGHDNRNRTFNPGRELMNRGLNLQETAEAGREVNLYLNYSYTFAGVKDTVEAQMYRWDAKARQWQIC
tara:strand:- start:3574 stop:4188 length:615 start_codon:yes stop_codon:yes gene_type:complete